MEIFLKLKEDILNLIKNGSEIEEEIASKSGINKIDYGNKKVIEDLTDLFMKKLKKSDRNFFLWLYIIGNHVRDKFDGEWIIIHKFIKLGEFGPHFEIFDPAIINENEDLWNIANSCYSSYYKYNRLNRISFHTFYMLDVERSILKTKLYQNIRSIDEVIFLERD